MLYWRSTEKEFDGWNAVRKRLIIAAVLTEAKSAKAPGRPVFNSMMERLYRGEADGILCWKLDRLARNPVDGGAIIWAMKEHDVKITTPFQLYGQSEDNGFFEKVGVWC